MDKKTKNLQEMYKLGFTNKTLSLMTESQVEMILEKIKKKETKEVEEKKSLTFDPKADSKALSDAMNSKTYKSASTDPATGKVTLDMEESAEIGENKKSKKKYNPFAVCTASVGRKNKKKFEDCVMGVKKKLKEGRNPYEYLIESKMEEIVENNLSPKMTKGELLRIIAEKKMMIKN
jgi:hypothetical protein